VDGKTEQLRTRTKQFAIRIVHLFRSLPPATDAQVIGKQLLRSGTSVGANYRAACHARSRAEFIARIGVVSEEADETVFWIELLTELGVVKKNGLTHYLPRLGSLQQFLEHQGKPQSKNKASDLPNFGNLGIFGND
jgi:four helix bundle protein